MFIDTHAHIYLEQFEEDLEDVLARARDSGVATIVLPAIDVPSIRKAIELCERFDGLFAMAALHPSETKDASEKDFAAVAELCRNPHVVAIGETGLDYYWDRSFDDRQHAFLRRHIRLAVEEDLPIVFHNREAFDDLIRMVEEEAANASTGALRGIFHCFTGTSADAERVEKAGFLIGLGGIVTFKNADLDGMVRETPLKSIVLETDAPYLSPEPHRGKRNEPAHVREIAEKIAEIRSESVEEIARVTSENAARLFDIP